MSALAFPSFSTMLALGLITFTPAAGLTIVLVPGTAYTGSPTIILLEGALSPVEAGVMTPVLIPSSPELMGYFGLLGLVGVGYFGLLGPAGVGYFGLLGLEGVGYFGLPGP